MKISVRIVCCIGALGATACGSAPSSQPVLASSESTPGESKPGATAPSATAPGATAPKNAAPTAGYDARLSGYAYPFEVRYFSVTAQGQTLQLAYMVAEPQKPNGRVVTLLHGKNFSGAYWERTANDLSKAGYRVVMPDQLGFGKSSKPVDFQYSFQAMAEMTQGLLKSLGVEKSAIVGHSMGGMLATRFALMYPAQTESLTLVNPIGLEDWKRHVPYLSVDEWARRNEQATPSSIRSYMERSYFDGKWKSEYDALVDIQAGWATGPDSRQIARVSALHYDMIFTQPVVYEFGDLTVPTLLVIGQRDRTALGKGDVSPEVASKLGNYPKLGRAAKAAIAKAKLVELDNVGHVPQVEAFEAWMSALTSFLATQPGK